jgi:hypothetical protein
MSVSEHKELKEAIRALEAQWHILGDRRVGLSKRGEKVIAWEGILWHYLG